MAGRAARRATLRLAGWTAVTFLATLAIGLAMLADYQRNRRLERRQAVLETAVHLTATLNIEVNHALSATYALGSLVRHRQGDVGDFDRVAAEILDLHHGAHALQLVPDGRVSQVVPPETHEGAIGHDVLNDSPSSHEARAARDCRCMVLTRPFPLIQGGLGMVGRLPVFLPESNGDDRFWGFVAAVMRIDKLLAASGFDRIDEGGLEFRLSHDGRELAASSGWQASDPVVRNFAVPNGEWRLELQPQQGWQAGAPGAAAIVVVTAALAAALMFSLLRHPALLRQEIALRTGDLHRSNRLLRLSHSIHHALVHSRAESELVLWATSILTGEGGYRLALVDVDGCGNYAAGGSRLAEAMVAKEGATMTAASFAVPCGGRRGVLTVVSARHAAFGEAEVATLAGLAADLGFGIDALRAAAARDQSEALFRALVERSLVGVYVIQDSHFTYVNPKFAEVLGYAPEEIIGRLSAVELAVEGDREMVMNNIRRRLVDGMPSLHYQFSARHKDGHGVAVEVYGSTTMLRGRPVVIGTLLDVSQRQVFEETLRLRERAIDSSSNGVMITDARLPTHPIIYVNRAFERITGYGRDEVLGHRGRFLLGSDWEQPELAEIRAALKGKREANVVLRNYRRDGSMFWNELSLSPVRDASGEITHFVSIFNDVSERVRQQQDLLHQATHDALTGLANRTALTDRLGQMIRAADRSGETVAVLVMDVDRFKTINDGMGHTAGDELLRTVARRTVEALRGADTVARIGGDEFVVALGGLDNPDAVARVAAKLLAAVAEPLAVCGQEIAVSASIGIALYPRDGADAETLIRNADAAMYRVKGEGRNNFCFYAPEMNLRSLARLDLENALRRAVENGELEVYYQPKVSLADGRICGAEALVRWRHPTRGMVSPAEFIPLAEETGLVVAIGEWVLATAARQTLAWRELGHPLRVSVNVSARQLRRPDAVERISAILAEVGADPGLLELELTESSVMDQGSAAEEMLKRLRGLGLSISLDDFGTGYSSLSYLSRFPLDALKIDRSFVQEVLATDDGAAIASTIIAMARSLRLKVVAEGVETLDQVEFLRQEGCHEVQGFVYSRPVPAGEFAQLLDRFTDGLQAEAARMCALAI